MARKRGRWRWVLLWGAGVPTALLMLLQGLLATPWVRGKLTGRIEARIGLETRVGRISWTPWSGFEVRELRVAKPQGLGDSPLLRIEHLRLWPDYLSLARRGRELRGSR